MLGGASRDYESGSSQWQDCGDNTVMDGATSATFSAWINKESDVKDAVIMRKWRAGSQAFIYGEGDLGSFDEFRVGIQDSGTVLVEESTDGSLATGVWIHTIGVWEGGSTIALYKNNVALSLTEDTDSPTTIGDVAERMGIGARYNNGSTDLFYDGLIAYPAMYTSALSEADRNEIQYKPDIVATNIAFLQIADGLIDIGPNAVSCTNNSTTVSADGPPVMFGGGLPL